MSLTLCGKIQEKNEVFLYMHVAQTSLMQVVCLMSVCVKSDSGHAWPGRFFAQFCALAAGVMFPGFYE